MMDVVEFQDEEGGHPFSRWFASLNVQAALKARTAVARIEDGNFSNVKPVGQGVSAYKLNVGPGYRIYFGKDGETLVILLGGGTKKRQNRDVEQAQLLWKAYKQRKKKGLYHGINQRL